MAESENSKNSEKWEVLTSDRYLKIVSTVISLATAAIALPLLFIRQVVGAPAGQSISKLITCSAWVAWLSLTLAIAFGLAYSWVSVRWVKCALGQPTKLPRNSIERLADTLFVLMALGFVIGILAIGRFFLRICLAP